MRLTILLVAYPLALVAPGCVGGAEEIVRLLDERIHAAGHHAIVVAQEGSQVHGTLVPTAAVASPLDTEAKERAICATRRAIEFVLSQWRIDVVHFHGLDFPAYVPHQQVRMLATIHLPIGWYSLPALQSVSERVRLVCVSPSQRRSVAAAGFSSVVVENGVDLTPPGVTRKSAYAATLGRICPEKSFHEAIDAARLADIDLMVAGRAFPFEEHEDYFREAIQPRLDSRRRFIGPVNLEEKRRLLARARCLLVTSRVPETSSLVAMEALALRTPVIAFPSGALPDIVEHGRTGFIVRDVEEMAAAIHRVDDLRPEDCRNAAIARFAADRMAGEYLHLYDALRSQPVSECA